MINFGTMPQRSGDWGWFKNLLAKKVCQLQYEETPDLYLIYSYDGPEVFFCTIWRNDVPSSVQETYTQAQNDTDKADFETSGLPVANRSLSLKDSRGISAAVATKPEASKATIITHDWCDKTTWFSAAVHVVDEVPTATVLLTTYQLAHTFVIDNYHGKLVQEDYLVDAAGNSYRVVVKVDGVTQTEQDPHIGSGGAYTVNYAAGTVTFAPVLTVGAAVTVTYHYATSSVFYVRPLAGKVLTIDVVEVQFAADVVLKDTAIFQPYGLVDVFAPHLIPLGVPSGTKIPLGTPLKYKSFRDFLADATKAYPVYPALGIGNWRGLTQPIYVFNWDYITSTVLKDSYGLEIRISLEHDEPFEGSMSTATLYCYSGAE